MGKEFFSGKLCHILLYRELIYPGARPDEIWFRVSQRAVRFGKEKFLVVTGLRLMHMRPGLSRRLMMIRLMRSKARTTRMMRSNRS
ncbi:hypothetical protein LWI28_021213 [Acer negundo]|uniref:Uncharacterized protein n=1 Tax=Acer negundo TaxID=4023 RepID=A0AAD5P5P3_ACENE|nr:hypothetical protein LWI28_021213 [Acer negundo]